MPVCGFGGAVASALTSKKRRALGVAAEHERRIRKKRRRICQRASQSVSQRVGCCLRSPTLRLTWREIARPASNEQEKRPFLRVGLSVVAAPATARKSGKLRLSAACRWAAGGGPGELNAASDRYLRVENCVV